jgi:hypothetical protein
MSSLHESAPFSSSSWNPVSCCCGDVAAVAAPSRLPSDLPISIPPGCIYGPPKITANFFRSNLSSSPFGAVNEGHCSIAPLLIAGVVARGMPPRIPRLCLRHCLGVPIARPRLQQQAAVRGQCRRYVAASAPQVADPPPPSSTSSHKHAKSLNRPLPRPINPEGPLSAKKTCL